MLSPGAYTDGGIVFTARAGLADLPIPLHWTHAFPRLFASSKEDPKTLLDVGCCFGQDLRKLVVDGAPGSQLVGAELKPEFINLGYELFMDRKTYEGRFVQGDIFEDTPGSAMTALNGTIDIIHIASFLHLFGWDEQLKAAVRLVGFLKQKPGTIILGRQVGSSKPGEYPHPASAAGVTYSHDQETFQKLWTEVEKQTTTKWKLETSMKSVVMKGPTVELLYLEATRTE
jgi:SAM-dependent methyltransferase